MPPDMKHFALASIVIVVFAGVFFAAYLFISKNQSSQPSSTAVSISPTETLLGRDRDEHGCIPSAGYSWCESKQKCLRQWEEKCDGTVTPAIDETEVLKVVIKEALIAKHGPNAEKLNVSVSEISELYAKGGASEPGVGGGMWFAAKVGESWKLVWDGNGIITCSSFSEYPAFPSTIVPECYDEVTQQMVTR